MNLSKSVRAQLGTLALVLSVVEQVRVRLDEHSERLPRVRQALAILADDRNHCWRDTVQRHGIPYRIDAHGTYIMQFADISRHAQWNRYVAELYGRVLFSLPESAQREKGRIDAHAWINAVLIRVQEQADALPQLDRRRVILWSAVVGSLQSLYEIYDPELDNTNAMRQGAQWAEGLRV